MGTGGEITTAVAEKGLVHVRSPHSVPVALRRVEALAAARGLTVFAHIDFSGDAQRAGLEMRPTQLLLIGNPRAGTPLMVAVASVAIDLPLKVLTWEDDTGQTWLSYNAPEYLQARHGFPAELTANIAGIRGLVEAAVA
jgi:uncharacterized protein (DUF302 family)